MKLLYIVVYPIYPARQGGQVANAQLIEALSKHFDLVVLGNKRNTQIPSNIQSISFYRGGIFTYLQIFEIYKLYKLIKKQKFEKIIWNSPYMSPSLFLIKLLTSSHICYLAHNIEKDRFSNSSILSFFFELMERWAMKLSNQSFFLSYDDLTYAITHYKIPKNKTLWTPFGTFSSFDRKANANKSKLATKYGLNTSKKWIYFVGSMDFPPNVEAVAWILHNLAPSKDIKDCFEILIVGAYLPERYLRKIKELEHVHYLGYIEDLLTLIDSCDIMINPICSGAGIKTKLVQALALHKFCVSTSIGALGLIDSHNLKREDTASGFIEALLAYEQPKNTEKTFFDLYHYEAIVSKIIQSWK